jgi:hypothetical protein
MTELYKKINQKLCSSIPDKVKPVDWLIDNLKIGKESAYRRLRGDVPYMLEEVCQMASVLNFSLEDLVDRIDVFNDSTANNNDITIFLNSYLLYLQKAKAAKSSYSLTISTKLNMLSILEFDSLFKLFYFRNALHRNLVSKMSEIVIPKETLDCRNEILNMKINNHSYEYVFSRHVFSLVIDGILYYLGSKKITLNDAEVMMRDFNKLLDKIENQMLEGVDEQGNTHSYYLSMIDVEKNTFATGLEGDIFVSLWNFEFGHASYPSIVDAKNYRQLFNIRKKYSTLVTLSNEIDRARFMDKQKCMAEIKELKL